MKLIVDATFALEEYLRKTDWKGYDPYDGLTSRFIASTPFGRSSLIRLAWIQFFKRCPFNLRPLFLIKSDYNPKGNGLCLHGLVNLFKITGNNLYKDEAKRQIEILKIFKSPYVPEWAWGANVPWQARAFYIKANIPSVVYTNFIINAILDAYEVLEEDELLLMAESSAHFVLRRLNQTKSDNGICFSYTIDDKSIIYNASMLGAQLLLRVWEYFKKDELINKATEAVKFVMAAQEDDGSFRYGSASIHQWIDNFHTGFILDALFCYMSVTGDWSYRENLKKGVNFWRNMMFLRDGTPKYYSHKTYPINIHCFSQAIISFSKYRKLDREYLEFAKKIANLAISTMQHESGYFYFEKNRFFTNKIPYFRWSACWMFKALTTLLLEIENEK